MKIQTIIYPLCMAALLGSCHIYQTIQPSRSRYARLVQGSCFGERYPGIRYRQYGQSTLGEGFHRSSITSVDPLGSRKKYRLANRYVAGKRSSSQPDDFAFILPSFFLTLAPQGGVSSFDRMKGSWSWSLPVSASWELDLFGKILNTKRAAKAALLRSEAYRQAVQTQVVAAIANYYYTLLMLDKAVADHRRNCRIMGRKCRDHESDERGGDGQ